MRFDDFSLQIENVWGLVNVVAHGAGQAVLQLDVSYGIDWTVLKKQPPVEAFDMTVLERFSRYGNKSIANVQICARYVRYVVSSPSYMLCQVRQICGARTSNTECLFDRGRQAGMALYN